MTGTVYIQSNLKMMSEALKKMEDEPISSQKLRHFETNLRQIPDKQNEEKEVVCLFSMN